MSSIGRSAFYLGPLVWFVILVNALLISTVTGNTDFSCHHYGGRHLKNEKKTCTVGETQCYRMEYWSENKQTGGKLGDPKYIAGCRKDLGWAEQWKDLKACNEHTVSYPGISDRFISWVKQEDDNWRNEIENNIDKNIAYKVVMCYCENKDPKEPCNRKDATRIEMENNNGVAAQFQQGSHECYVYNNEERKANGNLRREKTADKFNQCFRIKYWTEDKENGKKIEEAKYIGGRRQDLPGLGGPWKFPNACKDYLVSETFSVAFLHDATDIGLEKWAKEIKTYKDVTQKDNRDFKIQMCYCTNEKDKNPCNAWNAQIGVSKSGVPTLFLTVALLAGAIVGVWFFVKSCQVNKEAHD